MIDSVSSINLGKHIKSLSNAGGHFSRVNYTPGNDSALIYIYKYLTSLNNLSSVQLDTFYIPSATPPLNSKPLFNVVATIKGNGDSTGYYIIGAHLDCSASRMGSSIWDQQWRTLKAPGADDNATGVALLLEAARILSDTSFGFKSDYSIKFIAFGAEESGPAYNGSHYGSTHYAQKAKSVNERILGMFSLDMIGYNNSYDYTSIVSNSLSSWLGEKLIDANNLYSIGLKLNSPPFPEATYSDHASFWNEGYRAVLIIENAPPWDSIPLYKANPFYHTSSDSFSTLNMNLVNKVAKLSLATVASLGARLTDVKEFKEETLPDKFYLSQNYPNPFNPTTFIDYSLPYGGIVSIKV